MTTERSIEGIGKTARPGAVPLTYSLNPLFQHSKSERIRGTILAVQTDEVVT